MLAQSAPAKPAPDIIVFTNGDQLTGTLERATGNSFVFKSDVVGEITVTADKIKELHSSGKFVALKNGEKITRASKTPSTITYQDSVITLADESSSTSVDTVPVKDLSVLIDGASYSKEVTGNPGIFQNWTGGVTGGASADQSTNYGETFTAALNLVRQVPTVDFLPPRTRSTVNVLETYGKLTQPTVPQTNPATPDAVAKTSIFHADAEHDKYLNSRLYALVDTSFDHNFAQGLSVQQIYGVGVGATVIKTPVQELDVKADVHYERQNYLEPTQIAGQPPLLTTPNTNLIGSSFAEMYHRNLPAKIVFTESVTLIPSWNDTNAYSGIGAAGLLFPVYHRFGLNLNLQDNFLNNPAYGYQKNSFQFVTGITYTLK